jgi:hypothetical protein
MEQLIREIFDSECSHLTIDQKLVRSIVDYVHSLTYKNDDHINFFGSNLCGVHVVRFLDNDRARWFEDVLEADEYSIEDKLYSAGRAQYKPVNPPKFAEAIHNEWEVSTDIMNLSCVWLLHQLSLNKTLKPELKKEAMFGILLVLQFKFFTSRYSRHFKYPADKQVAEAAAADMSYKYSIKKYGNWLNFFTNRSEEILKDDGLHAHALATMEDGKVIYMLNDIQGRIREMLKNLYDHYLKTRAQGSRVGVSSMVVVHDGEAMLKDSMNGVIQHINYLQSILSDQNSFIKPELTTIVEKLMSTMPPNHFNSTLVWISANCSSDYGTKIRNLVETILTHSFDYLSRNRGVVRNTSDLPGLLMKLKGIYMSSRSTDPVLLEIREQCEDIIQQATGIRSTSVLSAVRTGILLYITLRAVTKGYYSK